MNFWILSTVTLPMWASIKLLRVLRCPKHRSLSHRKFLSGGNTWKTMKIWVFIIMLKSCTVGMATYMRVDCWNWNFLNGKLPERKVMKKKLQNPKPFWRYPVMLARGHNVPPGLDTVKYLARDPSGQWHQSAALGQFVWLFIPLKTGMINDLFKSSRTVDKMIACWIDHGALVKSPTSL